MVSASPPGGSRFPVEPLPTAQSVLWRPAIQELAPAEGDASPIFIAQRALAAVEDHLVAAPHRALLGFLVGRVLEAPDTGMSYVVAHGAMRVPQMIVDGATERLVAESLAAAQRMLPPEDGVVVGWYRSDPKGQHMISAEDHQAHVRHFQRPWQFALVVTIRPTGMRGGFFRPADPGSPVVYLPFYELLDPATYRDGWKHPRVSWSNYWSPDPAVWRVQAESARAPRVTPSERPSGSRRLAPILGAETEDDFDVAWVRPPRVGRSAWGWWLVAGAAVLAAVVLGVRLGLRPAAAPTDVPPAPDSVTVPEPAAVQAVRRAIAEYRSRESLVANHQMTCDDLARGLADVDEQWLHYALAAPLATAPAAPAAPEDTTLATPERRLAADVEAVEADFERSGCPRP